MTGPTFAAMRLQAGMERSEVLTTMSTLKFYGSEVLARHWSEGRPERSL